MKPIEHNPNSLTPEQVGTTCPACGDQKGTMQDVCTICMLKGAILTPEKPAERTPEQLAEEWTANRFSLWTKQRCHCETLNSLERESFLAGHSAASGAPARRISTESGYFLGDGQEASPRIARSSKDANAKCPYCGGQFGAHYKHCSSLRGVRGDISESARETIERLTRERDEARKERDMVAGEERVISTGLDAVHRYRLIVYDLTPEIWEERKYETNTVKWRCMALNAVCRVKHDRDTALAALQTMREALEKIGRTSFSYDTANAGQRDLAGLLRSICEDARIAARPTPSTALRDHDLKLAERAFRQGRHSAQSPDLAMDNEAWKDSEIRAELTGGKENA